MGVHCETKGAQQRTTAAGLAYRSRRREGKKHTIWTDGDYEIAVPRHVEINEHTAKAILKLAEGSKL